MKILKEEKAFGFNSAAGPAMGGEGEIRSGIVNDFVDSRDELGAAHRRLQGGDEQPVVARSEEHTSELQSRLHLVCRLLLGTKKHTSELQSRLHLVCRLLLGIKKQPTELP